MREGERERKKVAPDPSGRRAEAEEGARSKLDRAKLERIEREAARKIATLEMSAKLRRTADEFCSVCAP